MTCQRSAPERRRAGNPPELTHHAGIQVARVKSPFNAEPLIMVGEVAWRD